jgi:hypothetical protein
MNETTRRKMTEEFWKHVQPSVEGYGDAINMLLRLLTRGQFDGALGQITGGEWEVAGTRRSTVRLRHGIRIHLDALGGGQIEDELHEPCPSCGEPYCLLDCDGSLADDPPETGDEARLRVEYNRAIDGLTSLVLAHACAGVAVNAPAYVEIGRAHV